MKKYAVIHHSWSFMDGIAIFRFKTEKEAYKYVKDFKGTKSNKNDQVEIIEIKNICRSEVIDENDGKQLYGFKLK